MFPRLEDDPDFSSVGRGGGRAKVCATSCANQPTTPLQFKDVRVLACDGRRWRYHIGKRLTVLPHRADTMHNELIHVAHAPGAMKKILDTFLSTKLPAGRRNDPEMRVPSVGKTKACG